MKLSRRTRFIGILLAVILLIAIGYQFTVPLTHIQLPAEPVGRIPLPVSLPGLGSEFIITNSILAAWLSMLVLIVLSFFGTRKASLVPSKLQNLLEAVVEAILGLVENVAGHERGRRFFPLVATIFLFLLVSNWMGLLPGYGTIGWLEELHQGGYKVGEFFGIPTLTNEKAAGGEGYILVPFLRSAATDLNIPLALALISVGVTQMAGVVVLGLRGYGRKFINLGRLGRFFTQLIKGPRKALFMTFFSGFIDFFVGLLETVSEFAKIISFTFRLFGNIFAGEVLLAVMVFLVPWVASLPFLGLELFVGFMQAFVFAFLTLIFLTMATASHAEEGH